MNKIKAAVAAAAALVGIGLGAAPASAGDIGVPAHCGNKQFGGTFLCGGDYGDGGTYFFFQDGNSEIFVIGTDQAVWTRWTSGSSHKMSNWTSLGGSFTSKVSITRQTIGGAFTITARGGDYNHMWSRDRSQSGNWNSWYVDGPPIAGGGSVGKS
ncbi:hypothetical protein ACFQ6N_31420 [Kitasatospora sp. NPDC056446]|uniref:hypothetical protein n=1 Tax=Kitasatospora sp. NPDC056446 TaxID=3345819 RepID=UPI003675C455